MKHKLLSLVALAGAMFVSTSVMAWDEPVKPERPKAPAYTGETTSPSADGTYYILNVGAGQFLGAGNDWGTRAVTTTQGMVTLDGEKANLSANNSHVLPFTIESAETPVDALWTADFVYIRCQNTNKDEGTNFLVHEANAAWVDGWTTEDNNRVETENNGYWEIREHDGNYYLVPLDPDVIPEEGESYSPLFGVHSTNMTATTSNTWSDARPDADYYVDWKFIDASNAADVQAYIDGPYAAYVENELAAYEAALAGYNKKSDLLTALQEADEAGVNTDAAAAVYNNPNATVAEIENAIYLLRAAMSEEVYDFSGASNENPMDVTDQVIVNPTFDTDVSGWDNKDGANFWFQARTDGQTDASKNYVTITNFAESWTASPNTLANGWFCQTHYNMPAGMYQLEMDCMATKQGVEDTEGAVEGVYFVVESNQGVIEQIPLKAPDYQPKHWSILFVSKGEPAISFGIRIENTTANWISCDNFKLTYFGESNRTAEQILLDKAISDAEAIDLEEVIASNAAKAALTSALEAAKAVKDSTDGETLSAAAAALNEAIANLNASKSDYASVDSFLDQLETMMTAASENGWDELSDALYDWKDEINQKYERGELTSEEIAALDDVLHSKIIEFLNTDGAIKEGNDLTFLLQNPHFKVGSTGNPTGWTINEGSMTELRLSTHNIETYHKTFDLSQTLPNMPVGVYDITLQGFARHDNTGVTDKTWLYGGITKAELIDLDTDVKQKRTEPIFSAETAEERPPMGDSNYDNMRGVQEDEEGNTPLYQANGMTGAYYWFQTENPKTGEPYYTNHVKVIMAQAGDLTIGIHSEATEDWVIFDNFQIKYLGVNGDVYNEAIEQKLGELQALAENDNTYLTGKASELVESIPAKAQAAMDNADVDASIAMLEQIEAAMDYIKAGNKLFDELDDLANNVILDRAMENPHSDANGYIDLVTVAANCKENASSFADNDALTAMINQVKGGWVAYVMSDASDSNSVEDPYDATDVIFNPDFELENANYWDINITGGNQGFQNNATYTNTTEDEEEIVVSNFVEAWRNNAILNDGDISQTILGALPAGYYRLEMDGYAVNQAGLPEEGVQGVYLYAKVGNEVYKTPIGIEATSGLPEHFVRDFYSNGTDIATIGILVESANCNWTVADNFKLYYIGQEAPDAVESLKANTNSNAAIAIYGIDGRQQGQLRRGINIVRTADGARKVMVK